MSQENTQGTKREVKVLSRVDTKENWKIINPELLDREIGYERETGKYKIGKLDENGQPTHWNDLDYAIGLIKADTKENWESNNPILSDKEIGYEQGTGRYKIGNGINHWNDLSYEINTDFEDKTIRAKGGAIFGQYEDEDIENCVLCVGNGYQSSNNQTHKKNSFVLYPNGDIETYGDIYIKVSEPGKNNATWHDSVPSYREINRIDLILDNLIAIGQDTPETVYDGDGNMAHAVLWVDTTPETGGLKYFDNINNEWKHVPVAYTD